MSDDSQVVDYVAPVRDAELRFRAMLDDKVSDPVALADLVEALDYLVETSWLCIGSAEHAFIARAIDWTDDELADAIEEQLEIEADVC